MRNLVNLAVAVAMLAAASLCAAQDQDGLTEKAVKMEELPKPVADTLRKELGNNQAQEIEAISYEGVVVLYEAEYQKDGKEAEIVVRPWGELVPASQLKEGDDPDEEGEDDEENDRAQAAAADEDGVDERKIEIGELPKVVADAFAKQLGAGPYKELEEIRYEGVVILYEAESDKGEVAVFPNGSIAHELKQDDDDEDGEDDEGDDNPV